VNFLKNKSKEQEIQFLLTIFKIEKIDAVVQLEYKQINFSKILTIL
jgi:hypothetical protein